ncbi:MFS transporter [Pacificimonas flava]|uniref:MFS transporter n=3 Tax=Sphingosinicellaceae TaxID=2820280 RepID=A0A219B8C6_9SPHN|nr:MFS transporter [Pacificimonas aurantium]OWV34640.1 MFS transporter [Pacificimonas flava]
MLFLVLFVTAAGNTALQSVLPAIGRELEIPDVAIAAIFSVSALMWTLSSPFWARQSDKRGRKKLVLLGMSGYLVSTAFCALVILGGLVGILGPLLIVILFAAFRSLFGLFGSASNPAAQAYVAVRTDRSRRTGALAVLASAFGLGTIVGPALAPFFIFPFVELSGPLFAFTAIALVTIILVQRYLPRDDPAEIERLRVAGEGRKRLSWFDPRIRPFVLYGLVAGNMQAVLSQTLGFHIIDSTALPPTEAQTFIGLAMMAGAGATLLAQWGLISMFGMEPRDLCRWGAVMALAGTATMIFSTDFYAITLSFALAMLGYGFARPGFSAGASLAVDIEDQGAAAGTVSAVNGASFILAPTVGVALYQLYEPLPYILSAAVLAVMTIYTLRSRAISGAAESA